jgi:outer membrane protein assembly factor BamB
MRLLPHSIHSALGLCLAAMATQAGQWPEFRGPSHQGVSTETNLPLHWTASSNVVWKAVIPGESWSSPIVWNQHVFLTTATDGGQTCRVLALDASTGRTLWDRAVFEQVPRRKEGRNTYATPTPATDGAHVFACFGDGSFAALDFTGTVVWTNRAYGFYSQHGLGSSPILHQGRLVMARDGSHDGEDKGLGWQKPWDRSYVLALDTRTGKQLWKTPRGLSRISHGSPTIWEHDGRTEVVSEAGDVVQGFDLGTGERLWSNEVLGEGKVPSTIISQGLVFTAGGWGGKETIKAFRLGGSGDQKETRLVWEQRKGMPKLASLLTLDDSVFALTDGGIVTCLRLGTGEIVWQERVGGNFAASPVAGAGRLYLVSDAGLTTVLEAGPTYRVLASNPLEEKVQASPALANGRIYLRTEHHLYCLGK